MINTRRYLSSRSALAYCSALALQVSISLISPSATALEQSAVKSPLVNYSLLMDIDRIGDKLIAVGERGHILLSADEATSWTQVDVPVRVTLTNVFFINEQLGWAVGHDGVVLRSSDGGNSWIKLFDGKQANQLMLTRANALLAAAQAALENAQTVQVDGQDNTQIETLALALENAEMFAGDAESFVEEGPTRPFLDLWFKNEQEGFILGAFGLFLHTLDGGESWSPWFEHIENPELFHLNAIKQINGKLYIAAEAGSLYRSDDDGLHWTLLDSPYEGSFFGIVGLGSHSVIAYGLRGNAYISHDSGESWTKINTGVDASLFAGVSLAEETTVLVGAGGVMLYLDGNGQLVKKMQHPRKLPISAVIAGKGGGKTAGLFTAGFGGVRKVQPLTVPSGTQAIKEEQGHE